MNPQRAISVISMLLAIPENKRDDFEYILINLDSVFSTCFYPQMMDVFMIDDDALRDFTSELRDCLRTVLMYYSDKKVLLYHASEKAKVHCELYPRWRMGKYKDREYNTYANDIWDQFKEVFTYLKNNAFMVDLQDTCDKEPSLLVRSIFNMDMFDAKKSIIVSRDKMDFLNIDIPGISIWDGTTMFTSGKFNEHSSKKFPKMASYMFRYYMAVRGEDKLAYPGVPGYAKKKSVDFIYNNFANIESALEGAMGEDWHKYVTLFNLDDILIDYNISEAKMIKDIKF